MMMSDKSSIGDWGLGTGDWGLGNSGPPLGIRGNGDWGTRGPLWG
ncbi:hypothetical protein FDUTEX481_01482 [Tolypothrix sp. PCC 7601]|nr:hypothetical protein FDUTEX481_01482 [Tolypothrix sp. PCC 7601]